MFRKYGLLGILMILFVELNFLLKIQPFAHWYFQIAWLGYILTIDALNYRLRGKSLLMNKTKEFILLFLIGAAFWWIFEFINYGVGNWDYGSLDSGLRAGGLNFWRATIAFSTVLPAVVETFHLLEGMHVWKRFHYRRYLHVTPQLLHGMIYMGILSFLLIFLIPKLAFPLVWLAFFLLLDPLNYMHGAPSLIRHVQHGNWRFLVLLGIAGLVCGFFWEFWNYWSINKWFYNIPYLGFLKIFEMPILGYLGYIPFAWELYAMWHFVMSLHLPWRKKANASASSEF